MVETSIMSIGCKRATPEQEAELGRALTYKIKGYFINKVPTGGITETIEYIKKNRLTKSADIMSNEIREWGAIKDFYKMFK